MVVTHFSPFVKQCLVTGGVALNMAGMGLVLGLSTVLLPQLRAPDSTIQIDDSSGSWIAAIPAFSIIVGNCIVPSIMTKFGRKIAILTTTTISAFGWVCLILSNSVEFMIAARFLQGIPMGMITILGPVIIGECTSPKNRGAFLMTLSLSIGLGVFLIHTIGIYLNWKTTSYICIVFVLLNLLIVLLTPETPSWLSNQGKYDECRKEFRALRGDNENDELEKMITADVDVNKEKETSDVSKTIFNRLEASLSYIKVTVKERAFYKPIIIMLHLYTMAQWSGSNVVTSYTLDLVEHVIGSEVNVATIVISIDIQRLITSTISLIIIKKIRRRLLLFLTVPLNIIMYLILAGYTYGKENNLLPYDSPYIGIVLVHIHVFSIATGALPLSYVLSGELYPMQYKGLCGGISSLFMSLNIFVVVKTIPVLFSSIGFSLAYLLYGCVLGYCLFIVGILLPETKDRTLQDIEEELRGRQCPLPK
ncbi:facilitated trehalose transporter Tret1-like [Achroia grisella]|uniref:facilitated trehalose transporter Tret1-like n=1 Tax=Achroia grisella TaxID=688607 RepID=UPI0027D2C31C|nr:facilitated trehalose transporter Tret1-like [Achroia grisella]